ncbi:uncharacterized protein LOC143534691 [Bidens hawaiensis]|uniref:uncharacterized protein LOC143534691 n=1 Tax=Bidens hawaiensis TaxID=980011 RepID=UPI004049EDA3
MTSGSDRFAVTASSAAAAAATATETVVTENETESGEADAALLIPPLLTSASVSKPLNKVTNLESFLDSVTPIVIAQKVNSRDQESREAETHPYYCIGDLWETFQEWSAYGVGVPFLLHGIHPTTQYYVPYLSGMQLYVDPKKARCPAKENDVDSHEPDHGTSSVLARSFDALNLNHQKVKPVLLRDNKPEAHGSRGTLAFEFMEQEQPHTRKSLADKVSVLASEFPELNKYRSCDLSPSSWICVAWYPIYRIPVGPTLKDLEASFLTLHSLSTQPGYNESEFRSRKAHGVHDTLDLSSKIRLPVIGLASYKLKCSIISPCDPKEHEQENVLFEAANNWLKRLKAPLPDYQFFLKRY